MVVNVVLVLAGVFVGCDSLIIHVFLHKKSYNFWT